MSEVASREELTFLRSLTQVPHREIDQMVADYRGFIEQNPDLAGRGLVYIMRRSEVRDQKEAAAQALIQSTAEFPILREAGRACLLGDGVYEIVNGVGADGQEIIGGLDSGLEPYQIVRVILKILQSNLSPKPTRFVKNLGRDWLRTIEADFNRFERIEIRNREGLLDLYRYLRHKPTSQRVHDLMFGEPPAGSIRDAVKKIHILSADGNYAAAARLALATDGLTMQVVSSFFPKDNPYGLLAKVSAMTPNEARNAIGEVERSGLLNDPDVRAAFEAKIARVNARTSVASVQHRKSSQAKDTRIQEQLQQAVQAKIRSSEPIRGRIFIAGDISASMDHTVKSMVQIVARIAAEAEENPVVVFHNDAARIQSVSDYSLGGLQRSFNMIRAGGGTAMGSVYHVLRDQWNSFDTGIFVTDCEEMRAPRLDSVLPRDGNPYLFIVRMWHRDMPQQIDGTPGFDSLTPHLSEKANVTVLDVDERFIDKGDYHVLDQLVALLRGERPKSLMEQIYETALPYRVGARHLI